MIQAARREGLGSEQVNQNYSTELTSNNITAINNDIHALITIIAGW